MQVDGEALFPKMVYKVQREGGASIGNRNEVERRDKLHGVGMMLRREAQMLKKVGRHRACVVRHIGSVYTVSNQGTLVWECEG